ncbi:unnamed protein product [Auanema sp. JU1783]|nr:unnamed protein product [Auanema sp. JU1783]
MNNRSSGQPTTEIQPFGVFVVRKIHAAQRDLANIPNPIEAFASYWRPDSSPASTGTRDHSRSNSLSRDDGLSSSRESARDSSLNRISEKITTATTSTSNSNRSRFARSNTTATSHAPGTSSCSSTYQTRRTNSCNNDDANTFQGAQASTVVTTMDQAKFDTAEIDKDRDLKMIVDWSLPIFDMAAHFPNTILSRLTYTIFKQADLFRIFKISPIKFFNYFHSLEEGYWDIPYHNRIHAADVLHGCYYLTCHGVRPSFGPSASPDSLLPQPLPPAQSMSASMSTLELMALYTAAAMHDYDHPGRTNAFLVACEDQKAILYNDRSVLENHHAAESWRLLCSKGCNFIENLDAAETKRFRYLVLEYILATDLKHHFEIIMTFNEKTTDMELSNESDRLLISKMIIKMADINSPCKPYPLHRQWTERICDEFYNQGDEEKQLNMTVTPYMDRDDAQVAKLQDSFIAHVVSPLAVAMNEAGLLPVLPGLVEPEMMINLKHNHQKWLQEIDSSSSSSVAGLGNGIIEEESSNSDSPDVLKRSPSIGSDVEDAFDMCTIQEHDEEEYL